MFNVPQLDVPDESIPAPPKPGTFERRTNPVKEDVRKRPPTATA